MITTCCPGWILFMEHFYHDLFNHMSSCKSPHEMLGMLTKTYYAKKAKIEADKLEAEILAEMERIESSM